MLKGISLQANRVRFRKLCGCLRVRLPDDVLCLIREFVPKDLQPGAMVGIVEGNRMHAFSPGGGRWKEIFTYGIHHSPPFWGDLTAVMDLLKSFTLLSSTKIASDSKRSRGIPHRFANALKGSCFIIFAIYLSDAPGGHFSSMEGTSVESTNHSAHQVRSGSPSRCHFDLKRKSGTLTFSTQCRMFASRGGGSGRVQGR